MNMINMTFQLVMYFFMLNILICLILRLMLDFTYKKKHFYYMAKFESLYYDLLSTRSES